MYCYDSPGGHNLFVAVSNTGGGNHHLRKDHISRSSYGGFSWTSQDARVFYRGKAHIKDGTIKCTRGLMPKLEGVSLEG